MKNENVCPNCGHCPHCGRGYQFYPYIPIPSYMHPMYLPPIYTPICNAVGTVAPPMGVGKGTAGGNGTS